MDPNELRLIAETFQKSIEEGFRNGFRANNMRAFNPDGTAMSTPDKDATKSEWENFIKAANAQQSADKKFEYEAQISRQIDLLRTGNHKDAEATKKQIEKLEDALEKSQNGISQKEIDDYEKAKKQKKANKAVSKANAVINIIKGINDIIIAYKKKELAIARAQVDYNEKAVETRLKKEKALSGQAMKAITGGFTKNANDLAFDMVQSSYEITQASVMTAQEMKIAGKTLAKEAYAANAQATATYIGAAAAIGASIGAFVGGIGAPIGAIIGAGVGLIASIFSDWKSVAIEKRELAIKESEVAAKATENYLGVMQGMTQNWDQLYNQTAVFVLAIDDAARTFGASIGYTGRDFADSVLGVTQKTVTGGESLVKLFGKESEKLHEYLGNYMEASGRQVGMTAEDYGNVMGTAQLFGMSGAEASNLYGSMNIFNTSIADASDSMGNMYHQITRMGLSTKKFGKELVQNLKLAEKYNFKGGVANMMKITQWAQQTRFNLKNATNFADTLMNGSLSDVLEQSAKLQVLGGNAAIYSDPFGMLYDAWNDNGDLAQRMAAMFKDLPGVFNPETGEVKYEGYTRQMIAARAKAMGMDPGEALNYLRQADKQGRVNRALAGYDISDKDKVALGNRATWDKDTQSWVVVDKNDVKHDISDYATGKADINDLLPVETDKAILEVVKDALSELKKLNNQPEANMTQLGVQNKEEIFQTVERERKQLEDFYTNSWTEINQAFNSARNYSEQVVTAQIDNMNKLAHDIGALDDIYKGFIIEQRKLIDDISVYKDLRSKIGLVRNGVDNLTRVVYEETKSDLTEEDDGYGKLNGGVIRGVTDNKIIQDGVGNTNGGYILNSSSVKSINDGSINVRTARNDQYLAAKPNGPIDKILQQLIPGLQALLNPRVPSIPNNQSGSINLNFNGRIVLSQDGTSINLVEIMKNNPAMAMKFVKVLERAFEANKNGKPTHNYMV